MTQGTMDYFLEMIQIVIWIQEVFKGYCKNIVSVVFEQLNNKRYLKSDIFFIESTV